MLRLHIVSPGRFAAGPEKALYTHFADRFEGIARKAALGPLLLSEVVPRARTSESDALRAAIPAGAALIALDPRGASTTSEDLAALLAAKRDAGVAALAFLIGGAQGLGPLRGEAERLVSFGTATWPHLLVRGMLAEQLYRSATILINHPYHRGG